MVAFPLDRAVFHQVQGADRAALCLVVVVAVWLVQVAKGQRRQVAQRRWVDVQAGQVNFDNTKVVEDTPIPADPAMAMGLIALVETRRAVEMLPVPLRPLVPLAQRRPLPLFHLLIAGRRTTYALGSFIDNIFCISRLSIAVCGVKRKGR